jgi:sugar phosphate isomerase/epimerase
LRTSGALALGGLILPACSGVATSQAGAENQSEQAGEARVTAYPAAVGLQLYTLREQLEQDLEGTLRQVAQIGYKDLESAAGAKGHYYGLKPREFASLVEGMGIKLRSSHVLPGTQKEFPMTVPTLTNGLQQLVDMAAESGQGYLVCAYLFESERQRLDQYKRHFELFNRAGEACKKAGITFAYHNHDFEFETLEGERPYDLMLAQTDPDLVKMELDLYWATKSGNDPVALFEQHPGRFPLWHVKDMDRTEKQFFTEVGNGSIDFKRIFAQAEVAGMQHYFVEQDVTPGNPIDSITTSYKNLTDILA